MESPLVHRINFFEPKPQSIRCLSYDLTEKRLAVSRSNSTIEIWDMKEKPFLERIIPRTVCYSVETLCWCKGRLFSAGLEGYLIEYDLKELKPQYQICVTSGCPVWCMAANRIQNYVATGNEDGHVGMYKLSSDGLDFIQKFNKTEGGIFCLAWHRDGDILVTGSVDSIHVWNAKSGRAIRRITLARVSKKEPTIVWCIAITSDMQIISGDSCGKTTFWDGRIGTFLSSSGSDKEMVLSVCLDEENDVVYTSGINPVIFSYMKSESNGRWIKSIKRSAHTHDVRSLQMAGDFLVSGGDDCNLVFTKYPPKTIVKFVPFCEKSYTVIADLASCALFQYTDKLEVWKIPDPNIKKSLPPTHILTIKPKESESILCSSISSNGKWIAYSTQSKIRIFKTSLDKYAPELQKGLLPKYISSFAKQLLFTSDSAKLILLTNDKIYVFICVDLIVKLENVIEENMDTQDVSFADIHLMELSSDGCYLACSLFDGNVFVYNLNTVKIHSKLPKYKCQATVLKFDHGDLMVAYSDRKICLYSMETKAYASHFKKEVLNEIQNASYHPLLSICFNSLKIYLQDENTIYILNRTSSLQPKMKVQKTQDNFNNSSNCDLDGDFTKITKFKHISSIHSLDTNLVVVQNSPNKILECLPPPIFKKRYGT